MVKRKKTDSNVQKLIDALKAGKTRESACSYAEISRQTFYNRIDEDKDFLTLIEDAEGYWVGIVEDVKRKLVVEKEYRPAIEKELKSRARNVYGDKQEIEHSGEVKTIVVKLPDIN